jgi:hypothetical protein
MLHIHPRRWSAVVGLALVASGIGGLAAAAPSFTGDPTALDWYVGDNATVADPARSDVPLRLYDADGAVVTSGTVAGGLPAFAAADGAVRADDTHATLFVHAAQSGAAAGAWPGVQATGTDRFSGPGAVTVPAPLAGHPVVRTAGGYGLADVVASFASSGQGSFGGVYELRLRTSSAAKGVSDRYASAYVKVSGADWTVVAGPEAGVQPATTHTTGTAPATASYGRGFTVRATVTGISAAGGTVAVKKGTTTLATKALDADGIIDIPIGALALAPGTHALTVVFSGTAQAAASQGALSVKVVAARSTTTGRLAAAKIARTKAPKITAQVTAPGVPAAAFTGSFTVYDGSKAIKKVALTAANGGRLTITLPKRKAGTHRIKVVFSGNAKVTASTSPTYKLVVK